LRRQQSAETSLSLGADALRHARHSRGRLADGLVLASIGRPLAPKVQLREKSDQDSLADLTVTAVLEADSCDTVVSHFWQSFLSR
jgi:hypothetical protein